MWKDKKKEQVSIIGPHATPKLDRKKKKKIAQVPNKFESFELCIHAVKELAHEIDEAKILTFEHPSSFVGRVTYEKKDETMEIVLQDSIYPFCGIPRAVYNNFRTATSKGKYFNSIIKGSFDC